MLIRKTWFFSLKQLKIASQPILRPFLEKEKHVVFSQTFEEGQVTETPFIEK